MMVMERVRRVTKYFLWFIAGSFILFIFFGFGSNILSGGKREENIVAKVGKEEIPISEYGNLLRNALRNMSGAIGLDPIKERQISEEIINQLINDKIINDLLKKRKISISSEQVISLIKESPPTEILQNPNFWKEGNFDYEAYLQLLKDPRAEEFISSYASSIMKNFPLRVLRGEVLSMARVSGTEAVEKLLEDSLKIKIEYIKLPLREWGAKNFSISPEEFYLNNKELFRRTGEIKLGYVSFPVSISEEMVKMTEEIAKELVERAKTDSFDLLMRNYSYFPYTRSLFNGWVKRELLEKEILNVLDRMGKGEVSHPIKREEGFHIFKLLEKKKDSLHIKEIFLPFFPSDEDFDRVLEEAWKFVRDLRSDSNFRIPEKYNVAYITLKKGEIPDLPVNFGSFLFELQKGKVSYPLIGKDGFYVFWVEEKEEGIPSFSEIRKEVEDSLRIIEAAKEAKLYAFEHFYKKGEIPHNPPKGEWGNTPYFTLNNSQEFNIPEKVALLAFTGKKGEIFPPIRVGEYLYVVKIVDVKVPKNEELKELVPTFAFNLQKEKEAFYFQKWFQEERKKYKILDLRERLYE
ncbi:MAG: SurA N-terminal domain-containing protein [candidate division WOR-3 bacterium]